VVHITSNYAFVLNEHFRIKIRKQTHKDMMIYQLDENHLLLLEAGFS